MQPLDGTGVQSNVESWFASPFSSSMSVVQWALFLGLIIIICLAWSKVIGLILDAA